MPKKKVAKAKKKKTYARQTSIKSMDRVEVEWEDAHNRAGWLHDPLEHDPAIVFSVGYVIFNDKRGIKLSNGKSPTVEGNYEALGHMFIPRGMVRKVRKI